MLELLEPMRPHRHRVVCLLQASGMAYEASWPGLLAAQQDRSI